jgi:hypothetical protein
MTTWALSNASNPTVLRLHTSLELTQATIETCPPSTPRHPLDRLLEIPGIRSIDLHRYGVRLNLLPGPDRHAITGEVCELLVKEWGGASSKRADRARTFAVRLKGTQTSDRGLRPGLSSRSLDLRRVAATMRCQTRPPGQTAVS